MSVKDYMTRQVITISLDTPLWEAIQLLRVKKIKGLPVINDDGRVIGMFTLRNLLYIMENDTDLTIPVKHVMVTDVLIISENTPLEETCLLPRKRLPVINNEGKLVGILTKSDIIRGFKAKSVDAQQLYKELNAIIGSSYDGIFVTDSKGIVERMNLAAAKLLNIPERDVVGRSARSVAGSMRIDACISDRVIVEKTAQTVSIKQQGRIVALTGNPVFDEAGNIIRVVTNVRDLTQLSALKEELEQVSRLKDRYYSELASLKSQVAPYKAAFRSEEMQRIYDLALRVAAVDTSILIQGESGVGKEVLANYIHENSNRKQQPFIKINCAALPETLLESELFGYADGAFTGAKKNGKPGVFELANGATLFLDEVGEIPLSIQAKLLRAIQDQEVFKLGASRPVKFDVRMIFATNKNLDEEIRNGRFREDLYYRMSVLPITVPPLKNRQSDIVALSAAFLNRFNQKYHTDKKLSPEVLEVFTAYQWPGNVRELMNNIERMVLTSLDDIITVSDLSGSLLTYKESMGLSRHAGSLPLKNLMEMVESDMIAKSLAECKSLRQAARSLGIDPSTLLRKAKKYRLSTGE